MIGEKLDCGHRNDVPHLIAVLAGELLVAAQPNVPSKTVLELRDEFHAAVESVFKHAGIPALEIDGEQMFDVVRSERLFHHAKQAMSNAIASNKPPSIV
jgi:hypothetical protein